MKLMAIPLPLMPRTEINHLHDKGSMRPNTNPHIHSGQNYSQHPSQGTTSSTGPTSDPRSSVKRRAEESPSPPPPAPSQRPHLRAARPSWVASYEQGIRQSQVPLPRATQRARAIAALEHAHRDLFNAPGIEEVDASEGVIFNNVKDLDVSDFGDRRFACITVENGNETIGMGGVATCFGIVIRGTNRQNKQVITAEHDSDEGDHADVDTILAQMTEQMTEMGVRDLKYYVIGGQFSPAGPDDANTFIRERAFLSLRNRYNIVAVRLHTTVMEVDENGEECDGDRSGGINIVATADNIYFSHGDLYEPEDTSSASSADSPSDSEAR